MKTIVNDSVEVSKSEKPAKMTNQFNSWSTRIAILYRLFRLVLLQFLTFMSPRIIMKIIAFSAYQGHRSTISSIFLVRH